jgi:hypothetical protein
MMVRAVKDPSEAQGRKESRACREIRAFKDHLELP